MIGFQAVRDSDRRGPVIIKTRSFAIIQKKKPVVMYSKFQSIWIYVRSTPHLCSLRTISLIILWCPTTKMDHRNWSCTQEGWTDTMPLLSANSLYLWWAAVSFILIYSDKNSSLYLTSILLLVSRLSFYRSFNNSRVPWQHTIWPLTSSLLSVPRHLSNFIALVLLDRCNTQNVRWRKTWND